MSRTALASTRSEASTEASSSDSPRRRLSGRQADTVGRLLDATVAELRAVGFEGLTVRNVARRAGVAPATAYTYFSSREHLVAEVFWRRLAALPDVDDTGRQEAAPRAASAISEIALLVADEPALSAACTAALLSSDPEVRALRDRIGAAIHQRMATALDGVADESSVRVLDLVFSGAMVQAGMGHLRYEEMASRLGEATALLFAGPGGRATTT